MSHTSTSVFHGIDSLSSKIMMELAVITTSELVVTAVVSAQTITETESKFAGELAQIEAVSINSALNQLEGPSLINPVNKDTFPSIDLLVSNALSPIKCTGGKISYMIMRV